jgi:outer membrane protein OmpA-like peptidoglycan-associated protein/uncharacterized protein YidB (DUF937 family)
MALFDSIIGEVAQKFGLGDKASPLLSALLSLMTNDESGGLNGFLDRFRKAGLGDIVGSWIGGGESKALSTSQLESALGSNVLSTIASKAGLPLSTASPALAFMIPQIVDKLTPSGVIPNILPAGISSYITGALGNLGDAADAVKGAAGAAAGAAIGVAAAGASALGSGASRAAGMAGDAASRAAGMAGDAASRAAGVAGEAAAAGTSALWKVLPLLALLALAFIGYRACSSAPTPETRTAAIPTATPTVAAVTVPTPIMDAAAAVKEAGEKTMAALAGLKPGFNTDDLTKALNMQIINFASGKADIPAENMDILNKSAEAIKMAPKGTKIEIGGHTDNTGAAAGNLKLSQARATAVMQYLVKQGVDKGMLMAKGYGPEKPVATNDTDDGRFRNRRIEYSVVK